MGYLRFQQTHVSFQQFWGFQSHGVPPNHQTMEMCWKFQLFFPMVFSDVLMGCFLEPPLFSLQPISEMQHCNTSSSHSISPGRAHQTFRSLSLVKNWVPFGSQKSLGNSCELPPVQRWYIQDEAPKIAKLVYKWLINGLWQIFHTS
jgi:hypothetical protein